MIAYSLVQQTDKFCVVSDESNMHKCKTLTNGAEELVIQLRKNGLLKEGMRLAYYDTDGCLSELLWEDDPNNVKFGDSLTYSQIVNG